MSSVTSDDSLLQSSMEGLQIGVLCKCTRLLNNLLQVCNIQAYTTHGSNIQIAYRKTFHKRQHR